MDASPRTESRPWPVVAAVLALVLANLVAYGALLAPGRELVAWDDHDNLVANEALRRLDRESLRWMLLAAHLGVYEPASWLVKALEVRAFGFAPRTFHAVSLAMHVASALVLFATLRRVLARAGLRAVTGGALAGAALWSLHPLRTEVVAWASGQSYAQAGLFSMLALAAYVRSCEASGRRARWLAACGLLYALAVLSKSAAVLLPALFVALDAVPYGRLAGAERRRAWLEKLPFATIALAASLVAWRATADAQVDNTWALTPLEKAVRAAWVVSAYLGRALWPTELVPHYALPAGGLAVTAPRIALPVLATLVACAVVLARQRRAPWLGAAWWGYVALLLPVLGFVQHGAVTLGYDRYTYLSTLPLAAVAGAGFARLLATPWWRPAVAGACAAAVVLLGVTRAQTSVWRDTETLWRHTLAVDPGDSFAANNLGFHLAGEGRLEEAEGVLRLGYHAGRPSEKLVLNLGTTLEALGRLLEAARVYESALAGLPDSAKIHNNLAIMYLRTNRPELAGAHLERAVELDPEFEPARENLARHRAGAAVRPR